MNLVDSVLLSDDARLVSKRETGVAYIEGRVFGLTPDEQDRRISAALDRFLVGDSCTNEIRGLLEDDFEGVIVLHDERAGRSLLVNDMLGRLPVFYTHRPAAPWTAYTLAWTYRRFLG